MNSNTTLIVCLVLLITFTVVNKLKIRFTKEEVLDLMTTQWKSYPEILKEITQGRKGFLAAYTLTSHLVELSDEKIILYKEQPGGYPVYYKLR